MIKKQLHDEKMAKIDMLAEIENEKIKLKNEIKKEKGEAERPFDHDGRGRKNEKIMMMDISGFVLTMSIVVITGQQIAIR